MLNGISIAAGYNKEFADPLFFGVCGITLGAILFFKADWIGEHSAGHFFGGHLTTASSPGCLLKPFGILLFLGGVLLILDAVDIAVVP